MKRWKDIDSAPEDVPVMTYGRYMGNGAGQAPSSFFQAEATMHRLYDNRTGTPYWVWYTASGPPIRAGEYRPTHWHELDAPP